MIDENHSRTREVVRTMTSSTDHHAERIVIYPSRLKATLVLLGAIAFVVLGIWVGSPAMRSRVSLLSVILVSYVGVPFFSACGLYALYRIVIHRPALEIDWTGITDTSSAISAGHLNWEEIDHVVLYRYYSQPMLGIIPKDLDGFLNRLGSIRRSILQLNLRLGIAPINISQVVLPMSVAELGDLIRTRYGVRVEGGGS